MSFDLSDRIAIESRVLACRLDVLRRVLDFLEKTGGKGADRIPEIMSMDGLTAGPLAETKSPRGETGGPSGAVKAEVPTATADQSSQKTAAGRRPALAPVPDAVHEAKTGPLDGAEREQVRELAANGLTPAEIAARLGRSGKGFHLVVKNLVATAEDEVVEPKSPDGPAVQFRFETTSDTPRKDQAVHAILNSIGYPEPWTPETDWRMAETLASGGGVSGVVDNLGVPRASVLNRWRQMTPRDRTLDDQERLLRALRVRAEAWAQREAAE